MALFHLHLRLAGERIRDNEGIEFATAEEARAEAVRMFGELLLDQAGEFWNAESLRIEVTDIDDGLLFTLSFAAEASNGMSAFKEAALMPTPSPMQRQ